MKIFKIAAGQNQRIVRKRFSSLSQSIDFEVESDPPGAPLSGKVEVAKSAWIFPKQPTVLPLEARHSLEKSLWNTFFTVTVTPDRTVTLRVTKGHDRLNIVLLLGLVVLLAIGSVAAMAVLRMGP